MTIEGTVVCAGERREAYRNPPTAPTVRATATNSVTILALTPSRMLPSPEREMRDP
jgi:hypothetical protein